jgi:hypothetical protein
MTWKCDVVGNMIGDVGPTQLTWWIGLRGTETAKTKLEEFVVVRPQKAYVEVWPVANPRSRTRFEFWQQPLVRCGTGDHKHLAYEGWKATATGLCAGTAYRYCIVVGGTRAGAARGVTVPFATSAAGIRFELPPAAPGTFTALFSSCQQSKHKKDSEKVDTVQAAWSTVPTSISLNLLLGDTHYANSHTRHAKWEYSIEQLAVANYRRVIERVPTYAIYDDHDFLGNDDGGDSPKGRASTEYGTKRQRASRYFDGLWIIPPTPGRTRDSGCYHSFWHQGVLFLMLDTLYYRKTKPCGGDLLGVRQWAWLENVLATASPTTIKVLCSGCTLEDGDEGWEWKSYPDAVARLAAVLNAAPGGLRRTLFVSGDIHEVRYKSASEHTSSLKLPEVISSGIGLNPQAKTKHGGFALVTFDAVAGTARYALTKGLTTPASGDVFQPVLRRAVERVRARREATPPRGGEAARAR